VQPVDSPQTLLHVRRAAAGRGRTPPREPDDARGSRTTADAAHTGELLLARYRLCEQLGAGGFGVVWRAHDELLRREVAVKRVPRTPGADRERSSREALASARLAHPAIVALYEACATEHAFYLISELVHGQTLARLIADDALPDETVLAIGCALCDALTHAHSRGVIHRDVKPGNVIVPYAFLDNEAGVAAKLTDFGGAWMSGAGALTRTGDVLGTLAYMAPEQAEGRDAQEAADLYSLALVLYEALTGTNPVRGATPAETARRIGKRVPSLARARRDLEPGIATALDRALLVRPRSRGTLADLGEVLGDAHRALAPDADASEADTRAQSRAPQAPPPHAPDIERATTLLGARAPASTSAHAGTRARTPRHRREDERAVRDQDPRASHADSGYGHAAVFDDVEWSDDEAAVTRAPLTRRRRSAGAGSAALAASPHPATAAALLARDREREREPEPVPTKSARRGFPRALWLALACAVIAWQAAAGRPGVALLLAAASLPLLAVPRRSSGMWLLAALAPALGVVGLAGAFPAIAGQLATWRTRAALGALGYWWLTLAQPVSSVRLWLATPHPLPPRAVWEGSLSHALHVLTPMLTTGVLLGACVWAAAALVLPLVARGTSALADAALVGAWSVALLLAARALDGPLAAGATHASPRGAVLGALFGAALALGSRAIRGSA
jgi:eukaryotic-like serine/threonine-protein kinase